MKTLSRAIPTLAVAAALAAGARASHPGGEEPAAPTLDRIKALAGDWYVADENGAPTGALVSSYRVTAGGKAVLETIHPGTEMEMVTVYHQDGDDLVLTHYCMLDNQPHYVARNGERDGDLVFECQGASNLESEDQAHMHRGSLRFDGPDRYESEWLLTENGEVKERVANTLVRKKAN